MSARSTLYGVVESILENQGTSFSVLVPDRLDEGKGYEEITDELRERTGVPISSRTVRRWAGKAAA
jgi:hypothetical protein